MVIKHNNAHDFRVLNKANDHHNKATQFSSSEPLYLVSACSFDEAGCSALELSAISPFILYFRGNYEVINVFTKEKINKETNT